MSYTVIDSKKETHDYGWPTTIISISTTMSLISMDNGEVGLSYDAKATGIVTKTVSGGPIEVKDNISIVVNPTPEVAVTISQFSKTADYISMHVQITVDLPVFGKKTIYSQTLGGNYSRSTGWKDFLSEFEQISRTLPGVK